MSSSFAIDGPMMTWLADDLLAVYRDEKEQDIVRALAVVALGVLADPSEIPNFRDKILAGSDLVIGSP